MRKKNWLLDKEYLKIVFSCWIFRFSFFLFDIDDFFLLGSGKEVLSIFFMKICGYWLVKGLCWVIFFILGIILGFFLFLIKNDKSCFLVVCLRLFFCGFYLYS